MSKKANPTVIGAFVVGALALAITGIFIFGSGKLFKDTDTYVVFFDGSVKGLSIGAPVRFRGVRFGSVNDINALYEDDSGIIHIEVLIELDADTMTPIPGKDGEMDIFEDLPEAEVIPFLVEKRGLRAILEIQSFLTGQLFVNLDFYPGTPATLLGIEHEFQEIPAIPSTLEALSRTLDQLPLGEMIDDAQKTLNGISKLVNAPEIMESLQSFRTSMSSIQELAGTLEARIPSLVASLEDTSQETQGTMIQATDTLKDIQTLSRHADRGLRPVLDGIQASVRAATVTMERLQTTASRVDGMIADDSPLQIEINNMLRELAGAARSIRVMASYLEQHPEALLYGKGNRGGP